MTTKLPHLSDEHHFAIANVAARSAQLDYHIERTIEVTLRGQSKMAEFLLKTLSAVNIVNLLKTILLDAAPEEEPQIKNLILTINDLRSERNDILHRTWGPGGEPGTAMSVTRRPFREPRHTLRNAAQVQKIADEMLNATRALIKWQAFLRAHLVEPLPDKPAPPTLPTSSASP